MEGAPPVNAAIAALQPNPPPVVANTAVNQLLDKAYGNPVTKLERAHASAKRWKLAGGVYLGGGDISLDEYQRTMVHSIGEYVHLMKGKLEAVEGTSFLRVPAFFGALALMVTAIVAVVIYPKAWEPRSINITACVVVMFLSIMTRNFNILQQSMDTRIAATEQVTEQSMHAMSQSMQGLAKSVIDIENRMARTHNLTVRHRLSLLESIQRYPPAPQAGVSPRAADLVLVPKNFPLTLGDYSLLTNDEKKAMHLFYGLPVANGIDCALRRHLGIGMYPSSY